ncbi:MAG: hypothetical protein H6584_02130 [Flavobacteriales bacterium]|nr:hypothetical protein [Flavobacteriales bacterium]
MSVNSSEKEVDVLDIGKSLKSLVFGFAKMIVDVLTFLKKKAIILIAIIVVGGGVGYLIDEKFPKYESQVIVAANFESIDYLYNTIELINSKIKEKDTVYLKEVGITNHKEVKKISIEPVIDVYDFISKNPQNFEMIQLLSESGDAQSTIKDITTSKNYSSHQITLITSNKEISKGIIQSLLLYLNNNKFHEELRQVTIKNLDYQLQSNEEMIDQIDEILKGFSLEKQQGRSSDKLVYYNDNMQLNEIINTRNNLVVEQGKIRVQKQYFDRFIKEKSTSLNIKNTKGLSSKLKLVFPLIGLTLFLVMSLILSWAKKVE